MLTLHAQFVMRPKLPPRTQLLLKETAEIFAKRLMFVVDARSWHVNIRWGLSSRATLGQPGRGTKKP